MRNPLVTNKIWRNVYLLWWVLPGSIHFFVLVKVFRMSLSNAAWDAGASVAVLALLGMSLWYMLRYSFAQKENLQRELLFHLLTLLAVFAVWTAVSFGILSLVTAINRPFFQQTVLWRFLLFTPTWLTILLTYFLLSRNEDLKEKQLREALLEDRLKTAELNSLKARINPHFLFNSLHSISSLTMTNPARARQMVIHMADFYRHSLVSLKKDFITLGEEMEHALLYLEIEKARFGDKIKIENNITETVKSVEVPHLILQPLVENAVKHGVYESSTPVEIAFDFKMNEGYLLITISNNYSDEASVARAGTQTGLNNVKSRLLAAYGENGRMQIAHSRNIFKVTLTIPVVSGEKENKDE